MNLTTGDRITIVRKQRKLTLADIAGKTSISEDIIHAIEIDMYAPSFIEIIKITDALDISIDFIGGRISQNIDTTWLDRFDDIQLMSEKNKNVLIEMLNVLISSDKAKEIYIPTNAKIKVKKIKVS